MSEASMIQLLQQAFEEATLFVQNGKIDIRPARLLKSKRQRTTGFWLEEKSMYLVPNVLLVLAGKKKLIESPLDFDRTPFYSGIPYFIERFYSKNVSDLNFLSSRDKVTMGNLIDKFTRLERVAELKAQIQAHWTDVERNKEKYWNISCQKQLKRRKNDFHRKLTEMLGKCFDLCELDADVILSILKMNKAQVQTLYLFAANSEADLNFISLEDVRKAVELARVNKVMKS